MSDIDITAPFAILLGTAQDGGYPHAGCRNACCRAAHDDSSLQRLVSSLAIVDPIGKQRWIIDCTPDFPEQLRRLDEAMPANDFSQATSILLTHAHIGHYAGLIHLGREVMSTNAVQLFVMPRMLEFLENNAPWGQLISDGNVVPVPLHAGQPIQLNERLSIKPILVPHRDEYSETVCFRIEGPQGRLLFLPDIDGWELLDPPIEQLVAKVDVALLDGTFFDGSELAERDLSQIPHPRINDSLERFASLPQSDRAKVRFIHLNHTNPAVMSGSTAAIQIQSAGCHVAADGESHEL